MVRVSQARSQEWVSQVRASKARENKVSTNDARVCLYEEGR